MSFQNIHAQSKDQAGGITPGTDCTEKGTAGETCASTNQTLRCVRSPNPSALPMNSCSPYPCQFVQPITGVQTVYITKLPQSINLNTDSCAPSTADAYIPYSMPANTMDYKSDIRFEFNPSTYGFGLQSNITMLPANYSFIYTKYIVHDAPNCTYSGYSAPGVPTTFTVLYSKSIDTYTSQSADATHTCASYKVTPTCMYGAGFNTAPGSYLYCYDGCTGPDGAFIPNGGSKDYYKVNQALTCASQVETRVCTNGVLSGSATYASCNTTINGLCGSASGTSVAAAPSTSTDLCSAGTPSAVTGTGPWKWSCAGAYGGTTASCSASKNTGGSLCSWSMSSVLVKNDSYKNKYDVFASLLSGGGLHNANACTVSTSCNLGPGDFEDCTSSNTGAKHSCSETQCPMRTITWTCNCMCTKEETKVNYAVSGCEPYYNSSPEYYDPVLNNLSGYSAADQTNLKNKIDSLTSSGILSASDKTKVLNYVANVSSISKDGINDAANRTFRTRINSNVVLTVHRGLDVYSVCTPLPSKTMKIANESISLQVTCGLVYEWSLISAIPKKIGDGTDNCDLASQICDSTTVGTSYSCNDGLTLYHYQCTSY